MTQALSAAFPTDIALPAGAPKLELRREQRLCSLFRTAKLHASGHETLCRIRNISSNGFMADVCAVPAAGDPIALELCEGRHNSATVVWTAPGRFGARFTAPRSLAELIGDSARGPLQRVRSVRIALAEACVTIVHDGRTMRATVVNISQTGIAIYAYDLSLAPGMPRDLRIEIDGLETMGGLLCWAARGSAGIQFERPLSFEALSHWLWAASLAGRAEPGSVSG